MKSKNQLEALNKGQVVSEALALQSKLEAANSGPVTADIIKSEYLNLKKEGLDIAERRQSSKQSHKEALAKIEADKITEVKELELQFAATEQVDAKELDKAYEDLEKKSAKAISDLSFGLEKAENEANVKMEVINQAVSKLTEGHEDLIKSLKEEEIKLKSKYLESLNKLKESHLRLVEQTEYDQKIALRDENLKFVEKAAKELNSTVIDTKELETLKEVKPLDDEKLNGMIEVAVKAAKSSTFATEGAKYSALKGSTDSTIALLKNDKEHALSNLELANKRITELEARLKEVPTQIKDAVAAAKTEVVTNVDTAKK